ncbi:MAG: LD-carboxypeptidase [Proteobacteria bacterium]|nr:LD-carboxypeptidase [Pseudomonadota bacterium]
MNDQKKIIPDSLTTGDTIGIVAPAGSADMDRFGKGIEVLKDMGFQVVVPDDLFSPESYLAAPDYQRADIFNQMIADRAIKALICARGGFGTLRILSLVDFNSIRAHPKIVVGFSDITALIVNIYLKSGVVTYHGPVVTTLADAPMQTIDVLKGALTSGQSYQADFDQLASIQAGQAEGPLIGGNLATLCHLTGTPFMPDYDGHILFLEDIDEPLYKIDRMLTQMELTGSFNHVNGVVLGAFENCGDIELIYKLFHEKFHKHEIPVVGGLEIGHSHANVTIPIGAFAVVDADRGILMINPS